MRAWTLRHPNVMVVWWVLLLAAHFALTTVADELRDRSVPWWQWVLRLFVALWCMEKIRTWWRRT